MKEYGFQLHCNHIPALRSSISVFFSLLIILAAFSCSDHSQKKDKHINQVDTLLQKLDTAQKTLSNWSTDAINKRRFQIEHLAAHQSFEKNQAALDALKTAEDFTFLLEESLPQIRSEIELCKNQLESLRNEMVNKTFTAEMEKKYLADETNETELALIKLDYYYNRWNTHQLLIETLSNELKKEDNEVILP